MKALRISTFAFFALATLLSFTHENNLTSESNVEIVVATRDTIPPSEVYAFVNKEVADPVRKCFLKPRATKCYSGVEIDFGKMESQGGKVTFYENQMITGDLIEVDCGSKSHLLSFKIDYKKKKVWARPSAFSKWKPIESILEDCEAKQKCIEG